MLLLACALPALADDLAPADPRSDARIGLGAAVGGALTGGATFEGIARFRVAPALSIDPLLGFERSRFDYTTSSDDEEVVTSGITRDWGAGAALRVRVAQRDDVAVSALGRLLLVGSTDAVDPDQDALAQWFTEEAEDRALSGAIGVGVEGAVARHVSLGADATVGYLRWRDSEEDEDYFSSGTIRTLNLDPQVRLVVLFWP